MKDPDSGKALAARRPPSPLARYVPWLVLSVGLALTAVSIAIGHQQVAALEKDRLQAVTERVRADAVSQLGNYVSLVRSTAGFFEASYLEVSAEQFRRYLKSIDLESDFPGILSLAYIEKVPASKKAAFEAEQRLTNPDFKIFPESDRDPLFAATYIEPLTPARKRQLGFDPSSETSRRIALEKAQDFGVPSMSGPLILKAEEKEQHASPAFVMYAPIYNTAPTPATLEGRREALHGFITASFRVDELLRGIRGPTARSLVAFRIYAGNNTERANILMQTTDFPSQPRGIRRIETVAVAGFPWTFEFVSLPGFEVETGRSQLPYLGSLGVLFSLLLYGFTSLQARARRADERALHFERERARDLQNLDRAKTRFFSNLSHELRTPLNGILGMTDLLWDTEPSEQQKDYLTTIGTCGRTLLDLVSDVLDVSKIEAGKLELKDKPFKLRQAFDSALEVVRGQARGKELKLQLEWEDGLPVYVQGDLVRLRQVLVNLLSNAVKFTPAGSVTLRVQNTQNSLLVEVQDTGVGISSENIDKLFRPFSQVTVVESSEPLQGTGLGLVICKEIISLMKGSITVKSQVGVGTVFHFELPLQEVTPDQYDSERDDELSDTLEAGLSLLVADDNPVNLRVLLLQLHKLGYSVDGVDDGQKAIDAVKSKHYDLVLMDCQMPHLDGLEATRQIRREVGKTPVIIALTAHAQPEQKLECEAAGMDDFLTKPIELARLVRVLNSWQVKLKSS